MEKSFTAKIAEHAAWHFTGAAFLDWVKEECKKRARSYLGAGVMSGISAYFSHLLGLIGPWITIVALVMFVIILFLWDLAIAARKVPKTSEVGELSREGVRSEEFLALQSKVARYEQQEERATAMQAKRAEALEKAPQLFITYSENNRREALEFMNDGPETARNIRIEPLYWEEQRSIQLANTLSPIPSKHREVCEINFHDKQTGCVSLFEFMRSHTPPDAETTVLARYTEVTGHIWYSRKYTLETHMNGRFIWQPGEIEVTKLPA